MTDVIIGQIITVTGTVTVALISLANNRKITTVADKVDGLLEQKSIADKAIGNLEGRQELKDESKKIIPK